MTATDLLSVEALPTPIAEWFFKFESDPDIGNVRVVHSDGFRRVLQLGVTNEDLESEKSLGRIYIDDEGRCLYIYPVFPEEDESLYSVKDYVASGSRVERRRAELEGSVQLVEKLKFQLWVWRFLFALTVFTVLAR